MIEKDLFKLQNGSDVRGIALDGVEGEHINLTPDAANIIAAAFTVFLSRKLEKPANELRIAIGHDSRLSAESLKNAAMAGIIGQGASATDCGLASTPSMFMSIIFPETQMDGSIMITASHLPFNRNGLKFFTRDGGAEHDDIHAILKIAASLEPSAADISKAPELDLISIYSAHLCSKIRDGIGAGEKPLEGMHIVVDAGNGAGGFFAQKVLQVLGADTAGSRYLEPDGRFPNHIPNPENKAAMAAIKEAVLESKADLGIIFDTDVDRMSAVLPSGEDISRNSLIAMMAAILAPDYPGSTIITDSVTSDELSTFLQDELKLVHHRFKRGYKNVINECIRLNKEGTISPLAIETSGHGALSENYYLDDGAYLAVKLIIAAAKAFKEGKSLSHLVAKLGQPAEAKEYRFSIRDTEDFRSYGQNVLKTFEERARSKGISIAAPSFEGVRLVFPDKGWILLRLSLHDPNMPMNVESKYPGGILELAGIAAELLAGFDKLDTSGLS